MDNLKIRLCQMDLAWENKSQNLAHIEEILNNQNEASHILVLPEMFTTGFTMESRKLSESMSGSTVSKLKEWSEQYRQIITGSIIVEDNGQFYNRFLWVLPNGKVYFYDKRHLFSLAGEEKFYTAGSQRIITSVNGWKVNLIICYDLRFPVWCRNQGDYDILMVVANWPQTRDYAWKQLLITRAIENQCYVVAVNRVGGDPKGNEYLGRSMVVNPLGEVMHEMIQGEENIVTELDYNELIQIRKKLPFLNDRDSFIIT